MELIAKTEAKRLALFHLAQAFGIADADEAEQLERNREMLVRIRRKGRTALGRKIIAGKSTADSASALGLAFAQAAIQVGGHTPPYGVLTGVRPVKVALRYLNAGRKEGARLLEEKFLVSPDKGALLLELAETEVREKRENEVMLYVSIPFCPTRCRYCSFISSSAPDHLAMIPAYLDLLKQELARTGEGLASLGKTVSAVYVGGGTPGILSTEQILDLADSIRKDFGTDIPEFTFEIGRPDTVTTEKLSALKEAGVGRVCINPQTTRDEVLAINGRSHSAKDFFRAMETAKSLSFRAVNCDLIAGLPGDDRAGFLNSVKDVLALAPENVTIHALCRKKSAADQTDRTNGFFGITEAVARSHRLCKEKGLMPYYLYRQKNAVAGLENTGFALPGTLCRYNLCMMEDLCHIAACGAGAIGKVVPPRGGKICRFPRPKYPFEYLREPERIPDLCRAFTEAVKELV